jgi:sulfur relay (sulfurtransferase) DsrC/TusE family protein
MAENVSPELRLDSFEARLRVQEVVLQCVCKALATLDGRSAHAVAVALEVAELEQAEVTGDDDEVVRLLRRFRAQFEEPEPYGRG